MALSTLLQNQATGNATSLLGGVALLPPNPSSVLGGLEPGDFTRLVAPTSPGVGANDDAGTSGGDAEAQAGGFYGSENSGSAGDQADEVYQGAGGAETPGQTVTGSMNGITRPRIIPRPNVLDQFASYTYQVSVYLMTPEQWTALAKSKKKSINGYNLLFQSGGAPSNTGGFQAALNPTGPVSSGQATAGRSPAFPLDFYIDSCTVTNLMQGKGTGIAHSSQKLNFTVIEPVGITLIDKIYLAVQDAAPKGSNNKVNYQNAQYLMVIRWYGYDQNGIARGGSFNNTDPRAVSEKFIPFLIRRINWRVKPQATEYEFDCLPIGQIVAAGTRRGVVPYDIQLSQTTVGTILAGNLQYSNNTAGAQTPGQSTIQTEAAINEEDGSTYQRIVAPPTANAAASSKPVLKQGLMAAMNEFSQSLTKGDGKKNPIYEIADQYEIVFAPGAEAIRDATITFPYLEGSQTPMGVSSATTASALNPGTSRSENTIKNQPIYAGQPLVQVIDQVIRNSSYITSQALTKYDQDQEQPNNDNRTPKKPVDWYRINFEAVPIGNKQDNKRNDYAYKIRYVISAYRIDNYSSKYFPVGIFRGVHKSYNWIFTGQNTAVIDYSETLNSAYNMLVSGSDPTNSAAEIERRKVAATMREQETYAYGPGSGESRQGTRYKGNEVSSNIADSLYGGADLATTKLTIVGDPAWLQQGSLSGNLSEELWNPSSFLADGTINFDAEQVNFEVNWQTPEDYNLQTGLTQQSSQKISRTYTARRVTSYFKKGTFTQEIEGLLFNIPKDDGTNKAPNAAMPTRSASVPEGQNSAAAVGGQTSAALPEPSNTLPATGSDTENSSEPTTASDTTQPSPPPQAATDGNGNDLGDFNYSTVARLNDAGLNGTDAEQGDPQPISRDA